MARFIIQRETTGVGGTSVWFDAREFADKGEAAAWLKIDRQQEQLKTHAWGPTSYSGRSAQRIRMIELID